MTIFTVTCIGNVQEPQYESRRDRTWGFFLKFEDAEKAVLANATDMFEMGYYTHAVIEEVPEGILVHHKVKQWYFADYSKAKPREGYLPEPVVAKIDEPGWAKRTCNWSFG